MESVMLKTANELPSPTWNHLDINSIDLTVPAVEGFDQKKYDPQKIRPKRDVPLYNAQDAGSFDIPEGEAAPAGPWSFSTEGIACGMGEAVTGWLEAAGLYHKVVIPNGPGSETIATPFVVDLSDARFGSVAVFDFVVESGAAAHIILISSDDAAGVQKETSFPAENTCGWLVRIHAKEGSHVALDEYIGCSNATQMLSNIGIQEEDSAQVWVSQYYLGSGILASGIACDLKGFASRLDLDSRYCASANQVLDLAYAVRNRGKKSISNLAMHGVLADASSKSLRTTIDLVHGAKGASGVENEQVVLVGKDVANKSLPVILCNEDDVAGTHGASIGEIDPVQLSYMAARGIDSEEAKALVMEATFASAFAAAKDVPRARAAVLYAATQALGEAIAQELASDIEGGTYEFK